MNELALFAGAGGGILASQLLRHDIVCAVENEPYCQSILLQRQNDGILNSFPIWDDIRTFDAKPWRGTVDLVSGGFPCQAFSSAARGRNIKAKNLWPEMLRVVGECCPAFVFAENVSEKPIKTAKKDLENIGFKTEYIKLSASDLGADHKRPRFWLLAHSNINSELYGKKHDETFLLPKLQNSVWSSYAEQHELVNGLASRVVQNEAIGNGQVPIVAATAFCILISKFIKE